MDWKDALLIAKQRLTPLPYNLNPPELLSSKPPRQLFQQFFCAPSLKNLSQKSWRQVWMENELNWLPPSWSCAVQIKKKRNSLAKATTICPKKVRRSEHIWWFPYFVCPHQCQFSWIWVANHRDQKRCASHGPWNSHGLLQIVPAALTTQGRDSASRCLYPGKPKRGAAQTNDPADIASYFAQGWHWMANSLIFLFPPPSECN